MNPCVCEDQFFHSISEPVSHFLHDSII